MTDYWPHAPPHRLATSGVYMITAGTYLKRHLLSSPDRLSFFLKLMLKEAFVCGIHLAAWAVLSNHYHALLHDSADPPALSRFVSQLHRKAAIHLNRLDGKPMRQAFFQYWESQITHQTSYLARLRYVNENPVKHGIVKNAVDYRWCSAGWFRKVSRPSFCTAVARFKTDRLRVPDEF